MRRHLQSIATILIYTLPILINAQNPITNAGFEYWTSGEPDNWTTNNIALFALPVTQSTDSHSGSSALKGEVVDFQSNPWSPTVSSSGTMGPYFAVSHNYEKLIGYYKLSSLNNDNFTVSASLYDSNIGLVAITLDSITAPTASYLPFESIFDYSVGNGNNAAYCKIDFFIGNASGGATTIGSYFLIDDIELTSTASAVINKDSKIPGSYRLNQNYPNPFNPSTTFSFSIPNSEKVQLKIFTLLGQEVAQIIDEYLTAGSYTANWDAENLPSGVYLYELKSGNFVESRKMILIR